MDARQNWPATHKRTATKVVLGTIAVAALLSVAIVANFFARQGVETSPEELLAYVYEYATLDDEDTAPGATRCVTGDARRRPGGYV